MSKELVSEEVKENMAKAVHEFYRQLCKKEGWPVKYDIDYDQLPEDIKEDNLAAASRIPEVLDHAGLIVASENEPGVGIDKNGLESNIELLAEAEHNGWMKQKEQGGWKYGEHRDDEKKIHNTMIPYNTLSEDDKEKDRNAVRSYPEILKMAGCKIVQGK